MVLRLQGWHRSKSHLELANKAVAPNEIYGDVSKLSALHSVKLWFVLYNLDSWNVLEKKNHILQFLWICRHKFCSENVRNELIASPFSLEAPKLLLFFDFLSDTDNIWLQICLYARDILDQGTMQKVELLLGPFNQENGLFTWWPHSKSVAFIKAPKHWNFIVVVHVICKFFRNFV